MWTIAAIAIFIIVILAVCLSGRRLKLEDDGVIDGHRKHDDSYMSCSGQLGAASGEYYERGLPRRSDD
jgi:hypothetical protein